MPKSNQSHGGRAPRNFDPRYGDRKRTAQKGRRADEPRFGREEAPVGRQAAGPGSRSPKHRGYRPTEAEGAPRKQRWSAQERAGRDEARGIRQRAESGRRESPHHRGEHGDRPRFEGRRIEHGQQSGDRRFEERGRYEDRPRRDDRPRYDGDRRYDDRPRFDRRDGAPRDGSFREGARLEGGRRFEERPRFDGDRPRYDRDRRDDRGRPEGERGARPFRDDRPRFDGRREDRPFRDEERGGRDRFDRRPSDERRPYRDDRPSRDDRPRYDGDRPRYRSAEGTGRGARTGARVAGAGMGVHAARRFDRDDRRDGRGDRREDRGFGRRDRDDRAPRPSRSDWNPAATEQLEDVVHERLEAQAVAVDEIAATTFADLGLGSNIVETLTNMGAATPFPIQAGSIPAVLEGRDVLARGRTGSGKTIAFGAPLVERVLRAQAGQKRQFGRAPRALVLAPTRELALQIDRTIQPIARSVGLFTTQIYGGVPQARQVGALKKGVDIVIGTPGRIEDLIEQGRLDLSEVMVTVLDEADHMCELGFVEPVQRILRRIAPSTGTAEGSQKLLFSATLDREVAALVEEFLVNPAVYEVAGETQESSTIDHRVLVIDHRDKADILGSLVDREGKTLVFARTRAYAEMLAEQFDDAGIPALSLHGDLNQAKRTRNLQRLTDGRVQVLVATDVAARGIHVDDIDLVIQADAPDEYKTYLHRSGRTGRAGREGRVVTLITRQRRRRMTEMLERAEIDAPFEEARPGDDLIEEIAGRMTLADITA